MSILSKMGITDGPLTFGPVFNPTGGFECGIFRQKDYGTNEAIPIACTPIPNGDARLYMAAPELLETLIEFIEVEEKAHGGETCGTSEGRLVVEMATGQKWETIEKWRNEGH